MCKCLFETQFKAQKGCLAQIQRLGNHLSRLKLSHRIRSIFIIVLVGFHREQNQKTQFTILIPQESSFLTSISVDSNVGSPKITLSNTGLEDNQQKSVQNREYKQKQLRVRIFVKKNTLGATTATSVANGHQKRSQAWEKGSEARSLCLQGKLEPVWKNCRREIGHEIEKNSSTDKTLPRRYELPPEIRNSRTGCTTIASWGCH